MKATIVIATCGEDGWAELAWSRAYPSTNGQVFQNGDQPQVVIEHYPELSVPQARNAAAKSAYGDFLIFLDADDELGEGYVEAMDRARESRVLLGGLISQSMFVPDVEYVSVDGVADPPRCLRTEQPLYDLNWAVIGTMIPRWAFVESGGFPDEPIYEDWALWLYMHYRQGLPMLPVHDAVYRAHRGSGRNVGVEAAEVYDRYRRGYAHEFRPSTRHDPQQDRDATVTPGGA